MTTWDSVALGDLCSLITDGKHGDCRDEQDSGYYFISAKDVRDGNINYKNARQIREADFAETHRRTDLQPGDVLITNSGTIGRLAVASKDDVTSRTTFQKSVAILKPRTDRVTSPFLYYSLAANSDLLTNAAGGAAQKNLLLGDLRRLAIFVPNLTIQAQIADLLSTYDNLIENNRRRMALLEESARQLYREWFVRLRFPGYEHTPVVDGVPQGWEQAPLESALTLQRGFDLPTQDRQEGIVPIYGSTGILGYHDKAKAIAPGVVTGRSGTLGEVQYVAEDYWPLNTALWVKEFKRVTPLFALFLLREMDLKQFNGGASVPTLDRKSVHRVEVLIPSGQMLRSFDEFASDVFEQIKNLDAQNQKLRTARDLLLPRLMSGEIAV